MSDWQAAVVFYNGRRATDPAFDVVGDLFASRQAWNTLVERPNNWPELVKIVRSVFLVSINQAHRMILSHPGFRPLVQAAIDANADCAAYARQGIRKGWLGGLAEMRGDRPVIAL
ncbi:MULTISPECIES: hypothetical protein [unclassified Sphingopyxis]|uniref:hypothetical protein n=1 Tax=unclassified Sphingopyxis TaxID=2614943 RepID=UPI00073660EA|nr:MULTISPECIES: hypothetical protein [unclassified Sphingopyxis]KTE37539.1 hypothetical protein ATE62_13570 [Sphingopyxis sp. HIX]KTE82417.1 hypothetical protein ATE72_15755 [Sphingopyxis sp. HXXIV]